MSLLVGHYVPTKIIQVHDKDKPSFDGYYRRAFDLKQEAHIRWTVIALEFTGKSLFAVK